MEKLKGAIKRITYYNNENGYTVAIFSTDFKSSVNELAKKKILGKTIAVIGNFDKEPLIEEEFILNGTFVKNANYGLQFKINSFERLVLSNDDSIVRYFESDLFPGIGRKIAQTVVDELGQQAISLIKNDKSVLDKLDISEEKKNIIYSGIIFDQKNQESIIYLLKNGLSMEMSKKVVDKLGPSVVSILQENPYILMDKIERFGFKRNDLFATNIGISYNDPRRIKALIHYGLNELINSSGNTYVEKSLLYSKITNYLNEQIATDLFNQILTQLSIEKKIIINDEFIFDYRLYIEESQLAEKIVKLLKSKSKKYKNFENVYQELITNSDINYSEKQLQAIKDAFNRRIMIITGGPGTGKTTIIYEILKFYFKLNNDNQLLIDKVALLAPTGRAAKRLSDSCKMNASTIHKFLGYNGTSFQFDAKNQTDARLVIVDEASMMDVPLAHKLFTSLNDDASIIIVGDVDQLPSVGPGNVLKDMIASKEIETIALDKIHRQAEGSSIISLAHDVNCGILPQTLLEKQHDRSFICCDNQNLQNIIVQVVKKSIELGKDIMKEVQILIPIYKGDCGIDEINHLIQEIVCPKSAQEFKYLNHVYRLGDKVIQLVNHAEKNIMNGDIGFVDSFIFQGAKITGIRVKFDMVISEYQKDEIQELSLAYAISVHKAQGSEFDVVILPVSTKYFIMQKRKLVYTAITRAKKTLILMGDVLALQRGIGIVEAQRSTLLKELINQFFMNKFNTLKEYENTTKKQDTENSSLNIGEEEVVL